MFYRLQHRILLAAWLAITFADQQPLPNAIYRRVATPLMADEKDTEASRLAQEKFIPEFNRLSVEGPNNDDGPKKTLKPQRKHGKTNIKIQLRKTSSEVSNKKELRKASSEVSKKKDEKKDEKKEFRYTSAQGCCYGGGSRRYNKEFGRDTNRLDAFPGRPLEVSYDPKYGESDYYGGGHSGQQQHQQQSVSTIILDTDDLRPTDSYVTQEENIPNIGLGTIENVHAENTDIGWDNNTITDLSNCIIWFGMFGLVFWFYGMI